MGQYVSQKAKSGREMSVLVIPDRVIPNAFVAEQLVGKGNICRIKGTTGGFVSFGSTGIIVPTVLTKETLETEAGYFIVVATADYIRTSIAMRIEVTKD